ncbi:MAG: hypothetical protein ACRED5_13905 [Propylenella sp.]
MAKPIELTGREHKLLLDPAEFRKAPGDKMAGKFWARSLRPIIGSGLDARDSGESRAKGELSLNPRKQRLVRFFDTEDHLLDRNGFSLRSRVPVESGEPSGVAEVTLKFRASDILLAAEIADGARAVKVKKRKFEEDVAPLQVGPDNGSAKKVTRAKSHSAYSRFSLSLYLEFDDPLATLGAAFDRFGTFERALEDAASERIGGGMVLHSGPTICEWVFENAAVDLGDTTAEFGLTLWYFAEGRTQRARWKRAASGEVAPAVAEISFSYDTVDGRVDAAVSRRAMQLFKGMQAVLSVDRRATSKTALALPPPR